jgi:hypothetical protein
MNPVKARTTLALLALCASLTAAGEEAETPSPREDWKIVCDEFSCWIAGHSLRERRNFDSPDIVCDNTRTCRIVADMPIGSNPAIHASLLITRAAGPGALPEGKARIAIARWGKDNSPPPEIMMEYQGERRNHAAGELNYWLRFREELQYRQEDPSYPLSPAQIQSLLAAVAQDDGGEIGFSCNFCGHGWGVSTRGLSAALLKMDEIQGRADTPGALLRKGDKPEENVPPPPPLPVIRAAKTHDIPPRVLNKSGEAALKPFLWKSRGKACDIQNEKILRRPLDARHVLISTRCWHVEKFKDGYNEGHAFWVMRDTPEALPEFVTDEANAYENGVISGVFLEFLGNCAGKHWVWDGREFRQSAIWLTSKDIGLGHTMTGGPWRLPLFVTRVIDEDDKELPAN